MYVDNLLVLSNDPTCIMNTISDSYRLKNDSVQKTTTYLGAQIKDFCHPDDHTMVMQSLSADQYIKNALANLDFNLQRMGKRLLMKVTTPLASDYCPELDIGPYLDIDFTRFYQQLIGLALVCRTWSHRYAFTCGSLSPIFSSAPGRAFGSSSSCLCISEIAFMLKDSDGPCKTNMT